MSQADQFHGAHHPIDVLSSASRVMPSIVKEEHMNLAGQVRNVLANGVINLPAGLGDAK